MGCYVEHTNMTVASNEEALKFIMTALPEFRVRGSGQFENEELGLVKWVHVGTDRFYVCVNESSKGIRNKRTNMLDAGHNHVGFVVDDIEAVVQRLTDAGYKGSGILSDDPHRRNVYYSDPDGAQFEFVQYLSDDPAKRNTY